jgi:hypothetical protein
MDAGREDVTALLAEFTKANDRSRFRADSSCVHGVAAFGRQLHAARTERSYAAGHRGGARGLSIGCDACALLASLAGERDQPQPSAE